MTQTAQLQKAKLNKGDRIAKTVILCDIDSEDYTLWVTVKEVIANGGEVFYHCAFPDGLMMNSLIPESTITRFERGFVDPCVCGAETGKFQYCQSCGAEIYPF